MSPPPETSVIIVSRDRPAELQKVLACLQFQDISGFEVIVVTNTPSAVQAPMPVRVFDCDEANIAVARNVGRHAARGRFLAYCDDDALPDPSWLRALLAPFSDPEIGGTGGFTRGRNGISLQWGAVETDLSGVAHDLEIAPDENWVRFLPAQKSAPVMIGTNCAFRAVALEQIGGFDPDFAYFLDDSDISLRLSQAGWALAIVPRAQVHHGFAAGPYRAQNRVPKTLFPFGKSKALFCRKHAPEGALAKALAAFKSLQFKRLEKQLLAGLMEPSTLPALMKTLENGFEAGSQLPLTPSKRGKKPAAGAGPFLVPAPKDHVLLVGRPSDRATLDKTARCLAENGVVATVMVLSRSPAFMQANFSPRGYWTLTGGQFGKSRRSEPFLQIRSIHDKLMAEVERLARISKVSHVAYLHGINRKDTFLPQNGAMTCLNGFVVESV